MAKQHNMQFSRNFTAKKAAVHDRAQNTTCVHAYINNCRFLDKLKCRVTITHTHTHTGIYTYTHFCQCDYSLAKREVKIKRLWIILTLEVIGRLNPKFQSDRLHLSPGHPFFKSIFRKSHCISEIRNKKTCCVQISATGASRAGLRTAQAFPKPKAEWTNRTSDWKQQQHHVHTYDKQTQIHLKTQRQNTSQMPYLPALPTLLCTTPDLSNTILNFCVLECWALRKGTISKHKQTSSRFLNPLLNNALFKKHCA